MNLKKKVQINKRRSPYLHGIRRFLLGEKVKYDESFIQKLVDDNSGRCYTLFVSSYKLILREPHHSLEVAMCPLLIASNTALSSLNPPQWRRKRPRAWVSLLLLFE